MAHITEHTTATGGTRYRVRYRTNGRAAEEWFKKASDAKAKKVEVEGDEQSGRVVDPRKGARTLDDYFESWLAARLVKGRPLAPSTRIGYRWLYDRNISERIGKVHLRNLRPDTVRSWHGAVATAASQDQAAKSYRLLRAMLATAETDELIRQNPCRIRGGGEENTPERPMVATSLVLDLADAIEAPFRAFVLLAGFAGLRTGESLGLRRGDVDLLHGEVRVTQQAQQIPGSGRLELPPKSDAGRRTVALPRLVADALEEHLSTYTGPEPGAPVFVSTTGRPVRRATVSAAWRAAVAATGAPDGLRPHDLRHHAATLTARMPGVTTKELMARIGHASARAALIYQHATAERDRAIASYLDEVVESTDRPKKAPVVNLDEGTRGVDAGLASHNPKGPDSAQAV
jgi:integrase